MKLLRAIFGLIIILLVIGVLARNFIVKAAVEQGFKAYSGLPLTMGGLNIGLKNTLLDIDDLKVYNPSGFPEDLMVSVPDIYADYSLSDLMKGNIYLKDVRFHLNEFIIVKNKDGKTNLDSLKALMQPKEGAQQKKEGPSKQKGELKIDNLSLRIDRVIYKDYSAGGEPMVQTFDVNLNEKYSNIEDLNAVISLIVFKALFKTPIAALSGFDLNGLTSGLTGTLKSSTKLATDAVKSAEDILGNTTGGIKDTAETLKDKAKGLKKIFGKD
ncbi:MAG: AsmA family protein [Candidatus Omnitrophica bacterium]|nr:AsmA family protein [Candidatus Omnitrophota bacterium]